MTKLLRGKKVLITAGPTREYIDPVRYISNDSSGRMGYALAEAALKSGAKVTLVSGPTDLPKPCGIRLIPVISAREMYKAVMARFISADIIICAAAVADYRPRKILKHKIKKDDIRYTKYDMRTLKLITNPDILKSLGQHKKNGQLLIGFALETSNMRKNALEKLKEKNCDIIIANGPRNIGQSQATVSILDLRGGEKSFKDMNKSRISNDLIKLISQY